MQLECSNGSEAVRLKLMSPKTSQDVQHFEPVGMNFNPAVLWPPSIECREFADGVFRWRPFHLNHWKEIRLPSMFRSARLLRLDAKVLAEPSYGDHANNDPGSNGNGGGLASALALMALNQPDRFLSLRERLRSVIPAVRRIRFNRVPVSRIETETVKIDNDSLTALKKEYIGEEIVFDFQGAADIPAHLASEGTVLVLGLLAVLLGPDRPKLVLLDDLDRGLHPKAQRNLVQLLRKIMEEDHELRHGSKRPFFG